MLYAFYDYFDPYLASMYESFGLSTARAVEFANYSELFIAFILAALLFYFVRFILRVVIVRLIEKSKNSWDDILLDHGILHKASYLAPAFLLDVSVDGILNNLPGLLDFVHLGLDVYYAVIVAIVINSLISIVATASMTKSKENKVAIKGISQVLKIIVFVIMTIVIIAFILGREPGAILAGLGAASAIILLIFKDTILGFVGG